MVIKNKMFTYLVILALGIGVGVSISSSTTTSIDDDIIRTQYLKEIRGYNLGWVYDRHRDGGMYDLSFKFFRKPDTPPPEQPWGTWFFGSHSHPD